MQVKPLMRLVLLIARYCDATCSGTVQTPPVLQTHCRDSTARHTKRVHSYTNTSSVLGLHENIFWAHMFSGKQQGPGIGLLWLDRRYSFGLHWLSSYSQICNSHAQCMWECVLNCIVVEGGMCYTGSGSSQTVALEGSSRCLGASAAILWLWMETKNMKWTTDFSRCNLWIRIFLFTWNIPKCIAFQCGRG
jgi:hypothetical protein